MEAVHMDEGEALSTDYGQHQVNDESGEMS